MLLILFTAYVWYFYVQKEAMLTARVHSPKALLLPGLAVATIGLPKESNEEIKEIFGKEKLMQSIYDAKEVKIGPIWSLVLFATTLGCSTLCFYYTAELIESPTEEFGISPSFVGLVILPMILGAVEQIAATTQANEETMDSLVEATLVANIRVTLFVLPVAVCIGWALGVDEMTLSFDFFQIIMLMIGILIVNVIIQGTSARWWVFRNHVSNNTNFARLEGAMLLALYVLFANAAWLYPNDA